MNKPQLIMVQRYDKTVVSTSSSTDLAGDWPVTNQRQVAHYYCAEFDEAAGRCLLSWWNTENKNGGGTSVFAGTLKQAIEQAYLGVDNWFNEVVGLRN